MKLKVAIHTYDVDFMDNEAAVQITEAIDNVLDLYIEKNRKMLETAYRASVGFSENRMDKVVSNEEIENFFNDLHDRFINYLDIDEGQLRRAIVRGPDAIKQLINFYLTDVKVADIIGEIGHVLTGRPFAPERSETVAPSVQPLPTRVISALLKVAQKISSSKTPQKELVLQDIEKILKMIQ